MPRRPRNCSGGILFHVLNRAVGRGRLFDDDADYLAMERVIERTLERCPIRILSYCLMPNHWHFVLWPRGDEDVSQFMRLLTVTHTQRYHAHHHTAGTGPLYQGRFKSFPIQRDDHLLTACRYVERNAVRANLVRSANRWRWGSLAGRADKSRRHGLLPMDKWPIDVPANWGAYVDQPLTSKEVEALRLSIKRGRPFGDTKWQVRMADKLGLDSTLRPRGRPETNKDSRPL